MHIAKPAVFGPLGKELIEPIFRQNLTYLSLNRVFRISNQATYGESCVQRQLDIQQFDLHVFSKSAQSQKHIS